MSGSQETGQGRLLAFPGWVHGFAWIGLLGLGLGLMALCAHFQAREVWRGWTESRELRHPAYSEKVNLDAVFRTQANTWSNLAYVLVGLYAVGLGLNDLRQKAPAEASYLQRTPEMTILFGVTCSYLGFGSGFFHASLTRWGQQLDVAAMYSPVLVLIAINLGRWISRLRPSAGRGRLPTWPVLAALVVITSFLLYQYKWSMRSGVVLPSLILTVGGFALLDRFQTRYRMASGWLLGSTLALVAARICWQLDVAGAFSGPDTWLQGHAVWHLLTGVSLGAAYLYQRSEVVVKAG